jgi:hypothetical protein
VVQDLVVALALREVRAREPEQGLRDGEALPAARDRGVERALQRGDVEVAQHEEVLVLHVRLLHAPLHPRRQRLQLGDAYA